VYVNASATPVSSATRAPSPNGVPTNSAETRIIVRQTPPPSTLVVPPTTHLPTTASSAPIGWRTFVEPDVRLAVDYPPDWTVRFQDNAATFISPQGLTIRLVPVDPSALAPSNEIIQPNTRCSDTMNPYGIHVLTCRPTIGFSLGAYLQFKAPNGVATAAELSTESRGAVDVFDALVESARLAP
jgi:hypothetical protein